jgi:hypothetical protein
MSSTVEENDQVDYEDSDAYGLENLQIADDEKLGQNDENSWQPEVKGELKTSNMNPGLAEADEEMYQELKNLIQGEKGIQKLYSIFFDKKNSNAKVAISFGHLVKNFYGPQKNYSGSTLIFGFGKNEREPTQGRFGPFNAAKIKASSILRITLELKNIGIVLQVVPRRFFNKSINKFQKHFRDKIILLSFARQSESR